MVALYDTIGYGYASIRKPVPRIAKAIWRALGDADSVVNAGDGAGAYEPPDQYVVAVEPSMTMVTQRPARSASIVQATAMSLPFSKNVSFDAALAVLTVHHWPDKALGFKELRRVARRLVVVLTWDLAAPGFWLTNYFPEILDIDRPIFPAVSDFEQAFGTLTLETIPIPHDCSDGFLGAHWRRPDSSCVDAAPTRGSSHTTSNGPTTAGPDTTAHAHCERHTAQTGSSPRRAGRGQVRGKCRARAYSEPSARPTSIWRSLPSREMRTSQGLQHTSQS